MNKQTNVKNNCSQLLATSADKNCLLVFIASVLCAPVYEVWETGLCALRDFSVVFF